MSYSEVAICNLALSMLTTQPIRSLSDQNKRARLCYNFYPIVRDYVLYKYDWPFAKGIAPLVQSADPLADYGVHVEEPDGYYPFPADCLKPRWIDNAGTKTVWTMVGQGIITAVSSPTLHYTRALSDTKLFTMAFIYTVAYGIAMHLAEPLTGDSQKTSKYESMFEKALMDGGMQDTNIGSQYKNPDDQPENDTFVSPEGYYNEAEEDFLKIRGY